MSWTLVSSSGACRAPSRRALATAALAISLGWLCWACTEAPARSSISAGDRGPGSIADAPFEDAVDAGELTAVTVAGDVELEVGGGSERRDAATDDAQTAPDTGGADTVESSSDHRDAGGDVNAIACLTPCDCPESLSACLGGRCRAAPPDCGSDWECGCGEVCRDGRCGPPEFEIGCMWACECPVGLPWCGADFQCQAEQVTGEGWGRCVCGFEWDQGSEQCRRFAPRRCDDSSDCLHRHWRCQAGACVFGAPEVCGDAEPCPVPLTCDSVSGMCRD